ncbi:MAG: hypothetical protein K9J79_09980 [Desulfobacteraceae bacterium]|nr:hypothetical protein [Desulfobacteraceae bacterium]
MGRKRLRTGKLVFFYFAWGITVFLAGCASFTNMQQKHLAEEHLNKAERFLQRGGYARAIMENRKAEKLCSGREPGDRALYNMGQIWIDAENPGRSCRKSIKCFRRLLREYSDSDLAGEAANWVYVLGELVEVKKNLQGLEDKMHALREENRSLEKKAEGYKCRVKELKADLSSIRGRISKCREQLKKLKKIDLELNRKKEDNLNGERKNPGS